MISVELGVPEPTVALHARFVREAGLLTQGGRGRSAARMTPTDAAIVLIAVATGRSVKDTVETTRAYMDLEGRRAKGWFELPPGERQPPIRFVDALAWFIEFAGLFPERPTPPDMLVEMRGPIPRAKIEFTTADKTITWDNYEPLFRPRGWPGDLEITARFSHVAVFTVGALLAGKYPDLRTTPYVPPDRTGPRQIDLKVRASNDGN